MCLRAWSPVSMPTTRPRTSAQSHGSSVEWISTVIRGARRMFLARCRCGSVFTRTCSPSVSTQVSNACGWPSGISVTTVARFFPLASRTTSASSGTTHLREDSVAEDRDHDGAGEGMEAEVEAGHRGGDVGVHAEGIGVERVYGEHVAVRRVPGRRRGACEVLGPVVVAHAES